MRIIIVFLSVLFLLTLWTVKFLLGRIDLLKQEITELKHRLFDRKTSPEMSDEVRQERLERAKFAGNFHGDVDE